MNIVECENASFGYGGTERVSGVSFTLEKGKYLCIVGENGSGKSTLLKGMLGLLPPMKGKVKLNLSRTQLGWLPQQNETRRDFPATAQEVVLSGFAAKSARLPFYTKKEKSDALALLEKTGTAKLCRRRFGELSEGQKRRVLLSRALACAGELLVLDEPAAGLDPEHAAEMYRVIEKLHGEGVTMIAVTHDMDAARRADLLLCLNGGVPVYFGPPRTGGGAAK